MKIEIIVWYRIYYNISVNSVNTLSTLKLIFYKNIDNIDANAVSYGTIYRYISEVSLCRFSHRYVVKEQQERSTSLFKRQPLLSLPRTMQWDL
jgi:hypothetical protein